VSSVALSLRRPVRWQIPALLLLSALAGYAVSVSAIQPFVLVFAAPALLLALLGAPPVTSIILWFSAVPFLQFYFKFELPAGIPDLTAGRGLALVLVLLVLVREVRRRDRSALPIVWTSYWPIALFLLLRTLSGLRSSLPPSEAFLPVMDGVWVPVILYWFTLQATSSGRAADRVLKAILVVASVGALLGLLEVVLRLDQGILIYLGGHANYNVWESEGVRRGAGPYMNPASFGANMGVGMLVALGRVGLRRHHRLWGAAFVWCLLGVIVSFTRGAWMATAVGYMLFAILAARGRTVVVSSALLALITAGLVLTLGAHRQEVASRLAAESTAYSRLALAERGLQMIEQAPLRGFGVGGYRNQHHNYESIFGSPDNLSSHNTYLTIAVDSGLPCLLLIVLGFSRPIRRALRRIRLLPPDHPQRLRIAVIVSAIVVFAVSGLFIDLNSSIYDIALAFILLACLERLVCLEPELESASGKALASPSPRGSVQ
jgi:O-antigen ligase